MHRFSPSSWTRSAAGRRNRASLGMEVLEDRTCLSAPQVTLSVTQLMGRMVRITGQVTDERPHTAPVTLGGVVSGTVTPNASGQFIFDAQASGLGMISGTAHDDEGLSSMPAMVNLSNSAPSIHNFHKTPGPNGQVTLSGRVQDEAKGGLTVGFTGSSPFNATTDAAGNFSVTVPNGSYQAQVADAWGSASQLVPPGPEDNEPPDITSFTAARVMGNVWTFSGTVSDEYPQGCKVVLGGLLSLQNIVLTVDSMGRFSGTIQLQQGESGIATALAIDNHGLESELAEALVAPT